MKFSEQWLREWVNPAIDTDTLVSQVTMAGLEVDGVEPVAKEFSGVVIGEVLKAEQHPDADKLRVCEVSDGSETFQVVCGAPNVREGLRIPFAKIGAVLPGNFKIKKAKLRGVESQGMLCAESELGLSDDAAGLMELREDAPVGQNLRDYLQLEDQCIEVDLTPNRGDCLSIAGLAREVGVLNKAPVQGPEERAVEAVIKDTFPVRLDAPESCPRYLGRVIKDVDLSKGTPLWMTEKLRRCGLRSIDPAVDVTNYVLLELGQPMHAFDLDQLKGGIQVRNALEGEKLVLLDGQEAALREDTLVIADESGPLAMAGIMGGENSGVSANTQNIFMECAWFAPLAIAGKARSYGLHTDSSHRFERGVDTELQWRAMERATELLIEIVGGQAGPIVETKNEEHLPKPRQVSLRAARLASPLGIEVPPAEVEEILQRLGLELVEKKEGEWLFAVPSYRHDISIEPDLIEEVGRIYGYNNLPKTHAVGGLALRPDHEAVQPLDALRARLVGRGYQEAITYSFVDGQAQSQVDPEAVSIALANPISADMGVMRTNLWTGLLKAMSYNQNRQQARIKFFESGLTFNQINGKLVQKPSLAGAVYGLADEENWASTKRSLDFYDVKGDLEALFADIADDFSFVPGEHPALHPGQCANILKSGEKVGVLGAVHPKLQKSLDLNGPVYLFELCLEKTVQGQVPYFTEVSKYPEVRRDLAIVVDQAITYNEIEAVVKQAAGSDLVAMKVFDVYAGANLAENEKSVGVGLVWQRTDRTLQDDEVGTAFEQIVSALADKFDARLRS